MNIPYEITLTMPCARFRVKPQLGDRFIVNTHTYELRHFTVSTVKIGLGLCYEMELQLCEED